MATFQVFSTVLILILAQNSSILVNGSAIQRSLSDDIRHGISIAGKLFGEWLLLFSKNQWSLY